MLMVVDHVAAALALYHPDNEYLLVTRWTLTRFAMPIFMLVSGYLMATHRVSKKRFTQVAVVALIVNALWLTVPVGVEAPDILVIWLVCAFAQPLWVKYPVWFAAAGVLQSVTWEIPWGGYQPGLVLAFLCLGALAQQTGVRIPPLHDVDRPLAALGRHPLALYVTHIVVVSFVVAITNALISSTPA